MCTEVLSSGCWEFLGLEGEWISDVAATPWGVFVGTADRGVYRLEPSRAWTPLGPEAWHDRMIPQALLYVPADPPRLLAGLKWRHDSRDTIAATVYVSFDRGESWEPFDGGLSAGAPDPYRAFVDELAVDPDDPRRLFMGTFHGVLRSLDAGETWEFVLEGFNTFTNGFVDILIDRRSDGRLWVSGQGAIFAPFVMVSGDWGETWDGDVPTCNGTVFETLVNSLALAPGPSERLFAGADAALYRSDEGGVPGSWDCVPGTQGAVIDLEELDGALYATAAFVERELEPDGNVQELSDLGLYRTRDGGESWESLAVPDDAHGATEAAGDPEGNRLLIGTRAGLWAFMP